MLETYRSHLDLTRKNAAALPPARRELMESAADQIASCIREGGPIELHFICTHNSRRSHFGEVFATTAAIDQDVQQLHCRSGGTEATACNERVVRSLRRAGLSVVAPSPTDSNPIYLVQVCEKIAPIRLHSKRFDQPQSDLSKSVASGSTSSDDPTPNQPTRCVAMMCCSDAERACPIVPGAVARIPLHYEDPKISDGTESEAETYDLRRDQIAAEMMALVQGVRAKLTASAPN
ncbi:MAG: protein-tyrosine-phosphatase [Planctomycetota bacterium]